MLTYRFQSLSSTLNGKVPSLSYGYFPYDQYGNQWEVDTYIQVDEVQKIPTNLVKYKKPQPLKILGASELNTDNISTPTSCNIDVKASKNIGNFILKY